MDDVTAATIQTARPADPFAIPSSAPVPHRPRPFASWFGRWGRARRWLEPTALRVLDVGCAWGYTAQVIMAGVPGRVVVGVDRDPNTLAYGRQRFPWATLLQGDVSALPVPDDSADAVLLLDVIEHVGDPAPAIAEVRRVLRSGGVLVMSVPHRGLLHAFDALNAYRALKRRFGSLPPLPAITESADATHRHFTVDEVSGLLGPGFTIDKIARTGLGLSEFPYLLMLLARVPLRTPRVPPILMLVYTITNMLEDLIPTGPLGYNLAVRARSEPVLEQSDAHFNAQA